jgi:hypothetical protein
VWLGYFPLRAPAVLGNIPAPLLRHILADLVFVEQSTYLGRQNRRIQPVMLCAIFLAPKFIYVSQSVNPEIRHELYHFDALT